MAVQINPAGPFWPLGNIVVPTPGSSVCVMSLVDANNNSAPETVSGGGGPGAAAQTGFATTPVFHTLRVQGLKAGANNNGLVNNSGNIYICYGTANTNNRNDYGCVIQQVGAGVAVEIRLLEVDRDSGSPYRFRIDADTANDAAQCTLII